MYQYMTISLIFISVADFQIFAFINFNLGSKGNKQEADCKYLITTIFKLQLKVKKQFCFFSGIKLINKNKINE